MSFDVSADAYGRFMGRYSEPLADLFAAWVGVRAGQQVLDVGCGPGALTARLVARAGPAAVRAVDPSPSFVAALGERLPGVDVRAAGAEQLPFDDDTVDVALAQLVVHFMTDPVAGLTEMGRVTRPGGVVAACVWDLADTGGPLAVLWRAAHDLDPEAPDEAWRAGASKQDLAQLCRLAWQSEVEQSALTVRVPFSSVEEWWEPCTLGVGPAGAYVAGLSAPDRERLRNRCEQLLSPAPFTISATAWSVRATVR